ncbi:DUF2264 domain-containing protein [Gloeobacter morelensis]|nr:DUF2264 domain-containing protein [Gloeobacter morelensis]
MQAGMIDNPLRSRTDLQQAVRTLFSPLKAHFSPGRARVKLGHTAAVYPARTAELEGFARPLWGLVPLAAGGGEFDDWELYRTGLTHGSDPQHPEYWGPTGNRDQAYVEMAALGFALALIPERVWEPLKPHARANLAAWLGQINRAKLVDNNWQFFRVLVNLGLARVGAESDAASLSAALAQIDAFYLGDGWYSDGPTMRRDYYVPFAMHYYGLLYAGLAGGDPQRADRLRERAAAFAPQFAHWFAADGAALPFGRSLTYRFAQGAFWGALAFANVEVLPWGVIKGLALRHLRWWFRRPIAHNDGCLAIGYAYPNLNLAEGYNGPASPYWALKFFLPLALSDEHPFWLAEEAPLPELPSVHHQPHAGMILCRDRAGAHVFALSGTQHMPKLRHGAEKYAKFAYSTAFGFCVSSGANGLSQTACDSMLALTDDGDHYRLREEPLETTFEGDMLRSLWKPWPEVEIETWLLPCLPWHVRVHRLRTKKSLLSSEGGFAAARPEGVDEGALRHQGEGFALASYPIGWSGIRDLRAKRKGEIINIAPNTNLLYPRTVIPALLGWHLPGEHWLATAVLALPGEGAWLEVWNDPPSLPDLGRGLRHHPPRTVLYRPLLKKLPSYVQKFVSVANRVLKH